MTASLRRKYLHYRRMAGIQNIPVMSIDEWREWRKSIGSDPENPKRKPRTRLADHFARLRFARHRAQAKYRNIEFDFDFASWYQWWLDNGIDRNQPDPFDPDRTEPERNKMRLCMCRYNDTGPYTRDNVYLATHVQNTRDRWRKSDSN